MSNSSLILVIFTAIGLVASHVSSTNPVFASTACNVNLGTYAVGSPYETNLKTVLATLHQQANSTPASFYNTSSGTVHGQYYCRGDISTDLCAACVQEAAQGALKTCPLGKAAIVFKGGCTLRYSNQSEYGILEVDRPVHTDVYSGNVSDPQTFSVVLTTTINGLIEEAVKGNRRPSLFATGEGKVSANETVYCLVQCSPDLSRTQCDTCLRSIYQDDMSTCCGQWPATLYAMYPSCQMMYSTEGTFYFSTPNSPAPLTSAPPAPLTSAPPASSPVNTGSQPPTPSTLAVSHPSSPANGISADVRSRGSMKLGIVTSALVILMLVVNP